jgi:DNA-binding winged helix-turn-helix (wHTH) protein/predicted Ser/Thr protein kinase
MSTRSSRVSRIIRFDCYELDVRAGELRRDGQKIRIQEQPFRLLAMLAERPGEVVLREEIRRRLWPNDTAVEVSHGINAAVQRLREALGETAEAPRFVETVARRGYRFRGEAARAPELPAGTPGRFHILEKLGGGGMGVVYRAEDVRLGRPVAIKFLPPEAAGDPMAIGRFEREARAASALNHPNICTIHSVEEIGGQPAIVMELLEGATLESMLATGPVPLERALGIAIQMAAALEAAHAKGVVHRDLKPANVIVNDSQVKILDFGLATLPGGEVTQEGSVLGTPHYMSPEQVRGREVDARSDLYTFGLVLYELVTGRRASDATRPSIAPAALDRILQRCLAESPDDRWSSARELKAALEAIRTKRPPTRRRWCLVPSRAQWIGAAGGAALVIALVFAAEGHIRTVTPQVGRSSIRAPENRPIARLALSPDGRRLAFTAANRLYVRALDEPEARPIEGSDGAGTPFWSPDGRSVAFTAHGALQVSTLTGMPSIVAAVNTNLPGVWGKDGTILIGNVRDGIFRVSAKGGPMERVTVPDPGRGETRHLLPQFTGARGQFVFVAGGDPNRGMLYATALGSGERKAVMPVGSGVQFAGGVLVYCRDHMLLGRPFDEKRLETAGGESPIAAGVVSMPALGASLDIAEFSATANAIAYRASADPGAVTIVRNWRSLVR